MILPRIRSSATSWAMVSAMRMATENAAPKMTAMTNAIHQPFEELYLAASFLPLQLKPRDHCRGEDERGRVEEERERRGVMSKQMTERDPARDVGSDRPEAAEEKGRDGDGPVRRSQDQPIRFGQRSLRHEKGNA